MKKVIKIYLTKDIPADEILKCCFTVQSLKEALRKGEEEIITTQTHALTSSLFKDSDNLDLYDDIILIAGNQELSMKDILSGKYNKYIREIRMAHNWEKMFYSGIFYIPDVFTYEL